MSMELALVFGIVLSEAVLSMLAIARIRERLDRLENTTK